MRKLLTACKALGWIVLVPNIDDADDIPGLIIGTREFTDEHWVSQEFSAWDTEEDKAQ